MTISSFVMEDGLGDTVSSCVLHPKRRIAPDLVREILCAARPISRFLSLLRTACPDLFRQRSSIGKGRSAPVGGNRAKSNLGSGR